MSKLNKFSQVLGVGVCAFFLFFDSEAVASGSGGGLLTEAEIEKELVELARPWVRTLGRDVYLFHYRPRREDEKGYLVPQSQQLADSYTAYIRKTIDDPTTPLRALRFHDWFGDGLYAALDPIISSNYGGERGMWGGDSTHPWVLYRFALRKGSRYWNVLSAWKLKLSKNLRKSLRERYDCRADALNDLIILNSERAKNCRPLVRRLIAELEIDAIYYQWKSHPEYKKALCPKSPDAAFLVTKRTPFAKEDILIMNQVLPSAPDEASEEREMIQRIFYFSGQSKRSWRWPTLTPNKTEKAKALVETKEWVKEHLMSCWMPN